MKNILVLHTGGTISMKQDDNGVVSQSDENPLADFKHKLSKTTNIIEENILSLPSPNITPKEMMLLKDRIKKAEKEDIAGVIITHGTDTLEETAYFLDMTVDVSFPVVLTGAMRSGNEIGADGLKNFLNSILVILDENSIKRGVLVVLNDEIHCAKYVTKTHTTNVDTFKSVLTGPIGIISNGSVAYFFTADKTRTFNISSADGTVHLIKAYSGMDDTIFKLINNKNTDGVIIEAMGAGNLPFKTLPEIAKLIKNNIPVCLVSRCFNGLPQNIYDYDGGGVQLIDMGIIFIKEVNGPKARLKLLIGLNSDFSKEELDKYLKSS